MSQITQQHPGAGQAQPASLQRESVPKSCRRFGWKPNRREARETTTKRKTPKPTRERKAASPVDLQNYPHNIQGPVKGQPSERQETKRPRERRSCTIRRRSLAPREAPPARSTSESNFPKLVVEVSRSGTTPRKPGPLPAEGSTSYTRRTAPSLHYPMGREGQRTRDQGPKGPDCYCKLLLHIEEGGRG